MTYWKCGVSLGGVTHGASAAPYAPVHSHVHLARTRALSGRRAAGHTLRHRLRTLVADLPWLVRIGLVVLAVGALADLAYHASPDSLQPLLGAEGFRAHLVTFVGMLVMLIGVFRQGLARPVRQRGVVANAHR